MPHMRADKIKAGYSLPGFPNKKIVKVERFTKPVREGQMPWPKPWVRIHAEGLADPVECPPDWRLDVWTNTSKDLDDDQD